MTDASLLLAQQEREDRVLTREIDGRLDVLLSHADVSPEARGHLRELLKHYAKMPHPFRACVKDNTKRFGPGRVERVCAVLKDIIRGTTHWRGHPGEDHGSPGAVAASDSAPLLDESTEKLLLAIPDDRLEAFALAAQEAPHGR